MDPVIDWSEFVQARRMSDAVRMIEESYGFVQMVSAACVASSVLRCESTEAAQAVGEGGK